MNDDLFDSLFVPLLVATLSVGLSDYGFHSLQRT